MPLPERPWKWNCWAVFSSCQLVHSESAKVLGLTYQLWHKNELQPDFFKSAILCNCFPSMILFFWGKKKKSRVYKSTHTAQGLLNQGMCNILLQFLYACFETLSFIPSFIVIASPSISLYIYRNSSDLSINWLKRKQYTGISCIREHTDWCDVLTV